MRYLVIVIITSWFPHDQAQKVGKVFFEVHQKFSEETPLDKRIKMLVNNAVAVTKEGYKGVNAAEVKESDLVEFLDLANKQLIMFAEGIEGYKYQIDFFSPLTEALGWLGLKPPE